MTLGPLTIETNGVLNIAGDTGVALNDILTVMGTVNWINNPSITLDNDGAMLFGAIQTLPGGSGPSSATSRLRKPGARCNFFDNGTVVKTGSYGNTTFYIPFNNYSVVIADTGTMNF